jgi:phenylalanine-4-hydroxylase
MTQLSIDKLPPYLRRYCAEQDYQKYTPQDHASWRYIMRQSREYFRKHALGIYVEGVERTGIPLDRIPKISEMDKALQEFGWGAVPVCGFIPPIAFLDLQARGILPIATDMRTIKHIAYTPAPDIVHEAAGHAPIIADQGYREYLQRYAAMANKAIMSKEDLNLYEAIRILSDIKENPDATADDVVRAQKNLDVISAKVSHVSEATKVSRMAWWTVEYGLVGNLKNPKIYGAGLLSSVGESHTCLSEHVRKIPLSLKCIEMTYDITEPQPQLFVAESMQHLFDVLVELESKLSFKVGGVYGLEEARKAQTVNTVMLDNGLEVSGILTKYDAEISEGKGQPHFIAFQGPVQLCFKERELAGQGRSRHPSGFSTPIGRWKKCSDASPSELSDARLFEIGLRSGAIAKLEFCNGFVVEGRLLCVVREGGRILYMTWDQCTVTRGSDIYFEPAWGEFDMPVGEQVMSVFGGPSDREAYGEYEMGGVSTQPGRKSPFTPNEKRQFSWYSSIREARKQKTSLQAVAAEVLRAPDVDVDWLVILEIVESFKLGCIDASTAEGLKDKLVSQAKHEDAVTASLIKRGLALVDVLDS